MRTIKYIVVHCTATQPNATIDAIKRYWKDVMKWKTVGYHYIIKADGEIVNLLDIAHPSNGVAGWNSQIVNVCYIGGIDATGKPKDTRTAAQKASLLKVLKELKAKFPSAKIQGHKDFPKVSKACPSFDAKKEYMTL